jgi:hypothetical protein
VRDRAGRAMVRAAQTAQAQAQASAPRAIGGEGGVGSLSSSPQSPQSPPRPLRPLARTSTAEFESSRAALQTIISTPPRNVRASAAAVGEEDKAEGPEGPAATVVVVVANPGVGVATEHEFRGLRSLSGHGGGRGGSVAELRSELVAKLGLFLPPDRYTLSLLGPAATATAASATTTTAAARRGAEWVSVCDTCSCLLAPIGSTRPPLSVLWIRSNWQEDQEEEADRGGGGGGGGGRALAPDDELATTILGGRATLAIAVPSEPSADLVLSPP